MLQPFALNHAKSSQAKVIFSTKSTADVQVVEEWSNIGTNLQTFDRCALQQETAQMIAAQRRMVSEWRAINRGTASRWALLTINDVALSLFCGLMAIWILLIWQSDAPFWWVPWLASFFGIAAIAALHEAIWSTPQTRKVEMRKQLRQTRIQVRKLQNRLAMIGN